MAVSTRLIRLAWENDNEFKVDTKLNDGEWVTLLDMNENNHIADVWDDEVTGIITKYLKSKMDEIGNVMKA